MHRDKPNNPITLRLPLLLRKTFERYIEENDLVKSRFVRAAIVEKLRRERIARRLKKS